MPLLRCPHLACELSAILSVQPITSDLLARLAVHPDGADGYTLLNGMIRRKGHNYLGFNRTLQARVTEATHAGATGVHFGFPVTYRCVKHLLI
jgi:hypothetical protein